jgi:hypothetical protein
VTRLKWKLVLVRLEIVPILTQDRCTFCTKHARGSEIILDAPNGTAGDVGHVESHFGLLEESVRVSAR